MPGATKTITINAPIEKVFKTISDYEQYGSFVPKAKGARVVKRDGNKVRVEWQIDLGLKTIKYTTDMLEEPPNKLSWTFVEGEMMKQNKGSWKLTSKGETTEAVYNVEIEPNVPLMLKAVAGPVMTALVDADLPNMLNAFKKRAEGA